MADIPLWLQQLVYQLPGLLVSALVLALVYGRRCPGPALMTALGCGLLFLTALGYMGCHAVLWERMRASGMPHEQFARVMGLLGLASSGARAIGLALVVVAVFADRGPSPRARPAA